MTAVILIFALLLALILIGIEIPFTLGIATFLAIMIIDSPMDTGSIGQIAASVLPDSVTLMAIPLFAFTGSLISNSILGRNLIMAANAVVGRIRGGLAIVNIVASFLFGGISGSASADTASIGGVLIPMMVKDGYDKDFSVVVTITSSTLGPIVPPSIIMIVFGWLTSTSIAGLFLAGYVPGALLSLGLILLAVYYSYKRDYPISTGSTFKGSVITIFKQLPILFMPVSIIAGIVGGIFSPTEAGAFGVIYSLIILTLYGEIKNLNINKVLSEVASITGVVCFLLSFAAVFSRFLVYTKAPYYLAEFLMKYISSPFLFLLATVLVFIFLGTMMNPVAAMTMTLPVLFPISKQFGIHPLHFGIVTTISLALGHVSPPVGISLFIGTSIAKMKINEVIPLLLKFFLLMVGVIVIVILVPQVVLWLPSVFGFSG